MFCCCCLFVCLFVCFVCVCVCVFVFFGGGGGKGKYADSVGGGRESFSYMTRSAMLNILSCIET